MARMDLTGQKFGELTALSFAYRKGNSSHWNVRCSCGKEYVTSIGNLRCRKIKRCIDCSSRSARTHGQSGTSTHKYWLNIVGTHRSEVCDKWLSFDGFLCDMGERPTDKRFLRRIDSSLPYSKANCIWSETYQVNRSKATHARIYSSCGFTGNLGEWGQRLGISRERVRQLVNKFGSMDAVIEQRASDKGVSVAQVLDDFPDFDNSLSGCGHGNAKYPWDEWFDGQIWMLKKGVDFDISAKKIRQYSDYRSRLAGVKLRTAIIDEETVVIKKVGDRSMD